MTAFFLLNNATSIEATADPIVWARIIGSVLLLVSILWGVRFLGSKLNWLPEAQRKVIHMSLGLYAISFVLIFDGAWEVTVTCGLSIVLLLLVRLLPALRGLRGGLHSVKRYSYGEIFFACSIALLFYLRHPDSSLIFQIVHGHTALYILPILILTLCDAAAAVVGVIYAKTSFKVEEGTKSWEGTTFFFLTAWLLCLISLLLLTDVDRREVILIALILAMFGALIEAISWKGMDNLFVPLGLFLLLRSMLHLPLDTLLVHTGVFISLFLLGIAIAYVRHRDVPTCCLAMTGLYLFWIVGSWANLTAPVAVYGVHLFLSYKNRRKHDDMNVVTSVIGLALIWYIVAVVSGYQVYFVFNLALSIYLACLLILKSEEAPIRWLFTIAMICTLVNMTHVLFMASVTPALITGRLIGTVTLLGIAVFLVHRQRAMFENHRWSRQFALALFLSIFGVPVTLW